jgi:hypothetical protein
MGIHDYPSPESSEMTDRSKRTRYFSPIAIHGGFILTAAALVMNVSCGLAKAQENAPCMRITAACSDAGFKAGSAKEGFGLMADCVDPIMQGVPQRAKATKPLPPIDAKLIAACKAKNPDFGQRKDAPSRSSHGNELPRPGSDGSLNDTAKSP